MNQTIAVPGRTTRQAGGHGLLGLATALLITAAAGAGVWQATDGGGGAAPAARPAAFAPVPMTLTEPVVTYYLVATEAQALQVSAAQDEAARIMRDSGAQGTLHESRAFVIGTVAEQREVLAHIRETNLVRLSAGLEEVRVIDLR